MSRPAAIFVLFAVAVSLAAGEAARGHERPHERWIWTELIGFDNCQEDLGVGEYFHKAGFTPTAVCLLLTTPDFILSHRGIGEPAALPPDCCSRDGHELNRERKRQVWTNHQLRDLIGQLHARGIEVYLTVFTRFCQNQYRHEWLSDHREVFLVYKSTGTAWGMNPLARLADGSYLEDYFAAQLVAVLRDYGFDGWHGADGYGPSNGPIYEVSFSDDMVEQFAGAGNHDLPEVVTRTCGHEADKLEARAAWIWQNARQAWIEFYANRWATFWRKVATALHEAGKKAVINSAWGRDPFESLYRYGIDYRKIVNAGVDGIVVETVAAGLAMDPRTVGTERHYDFLSMLMLLRAYVPESKLIFLHNTHDVVEQWDALRHVPALLEREIYSLANVYHTGGDGRLTPSADGFLVCLGDGIARDEWAWLSEKWELAFRPTPRRTLGATLVWSDTALRCEIDEFPRSRAPFTHRLTSQLMLLGAPVQSTVRTEAIENVAGPVLVLNPHLFPPDELAGVFGYTGGPVLAIGRKPAGVRPPDAEFQDTSGPYPLWCGVWGAKLQSVPKMESAPEDPLPEGWTKLPEPRGYWDQLNCRKASEGFFRACVQATVEASRCPRVVAEQDSVTLMAQEQPDGRLEIALKSTIHAYARPQIELGRPIESIEVLTRFPSVLIRPEGSRFSVRVPGKGIVVVAVQLQEVEGR